jgi:uncharacterized protein YcbK (DUF882 family)
MGQRLTANFTLAELTKTRHDLDNTPSPQVVQNLQLLAEKVLQPLRDAVGPVNVTSGYRSKLVNAGSKRRTQRATTFTATRRTCKARTVTTESFTTG